MKNEIKTIIGTIVTIIGIIIAIVSLFVGFSSFTHNFDDFAVPFIILGIGNGIITSVLGLLVCCLSNSKESNDNYTKNK